MDRKTKIFGALALGLAGLGTAGYAATAGMGAGDHEAMEDAVEAAAVRRQNIWHNSRRRIAECGPRLGLMFRRRARGVASADIRVSVA